MHKLTVQISDAKMVQTLQDLAKSLGYVQTRGGSKGSGSISQMVQAIANHQLVLVKKEPQHDEDNMRLVPHSTRNSAG